MYTLRVAPIILFLCGLCASAPVLGQEGEPDDGTTVTPESEHSYVDLDDLKGTLLELCEALSSVQEVQLDDLAEADREAFVGLFSICDGLEESAAEDDEPVEDEEPADNEVESHESGETLPPVPVEIQRHPSNNQGGDGPGDESYGDDGVF